MAPKVAIFGESPHTKMFEFAIFRLQVSPGNQTKKEILVVSGPGLISDKLKGNSTLPQLS